jgi:hypothetical protein
MKINHFIFCSLLCITVSSHAMKIIKKVKKHKPHKEQKNTFRHPIITDFLVTQRMLNNKQLPPDIATQIRQLCIQLRNKTFENNFISLNVWDDFAIPRYYHYYLTPEQTNCLELLMYRPPSRIPHPEEKRIAMHYNLNDKKEYNIFKTIPIEIRRYLTKLPQSAQGKHWYTNTDINEYKIVCVGNSASSTKGKFIIPEEKIKHVKLDVNR